MKCIILSHPFDHSFGPPVQQDNLCEIMTLDGVLITEMERDDASSEGFFFLILFLFDSGNDAGVQSDHLIKI